MKSSSFQPPWKMSSEKPDQRVERTPENVADIPNIEEPMESLYSPLQPARPARAKHQRNEEPRYSQKGEPTYPAYENTSNEDAVVSSIPPLQDYHPEGTMDYEEEEFDYSRQAADSTAVDFMDVEDGNSTDRRPLDRSLALDIGRTPEPAIFQKLTHLDGTTEELRIRSVREVPEKFRHIFPYRNFNALQSKVFSFLSSIIYMPVMIE